MIQIRIANLTKLGQLFLHHPSPTHALSFTASPNGVLMAAGTSTAHPTGTRDHGLPRSCADLHSRRFQPNVMLTYMLHVHVCYMYMYTCMSHLLVGRAALSALSIGPLDWSTTVLDTATTDVSRETTPHIHMRHVSTQILSMQHARHHDT